MILASIVLHKFGTKPSEAAFSTAIRDNIRPEVANEVVSGVAVECVSMDMRVKFDLVFLDQIVLQIYEPLTF